MYFLLLKVTLLHGSFLRFLNCTNSTKSRKASHLFRVEYFDSMNYAWFGKLKAVLNAVVLRNEILNLINVIITLPALEEEHFLTLILCQTSSHL